MKTSVKTSANLALFAAVFILSFVGLKVSNTDAESINNYIGWNIDQDREQIIFGGHINSFIGSSSTWINKISLYAPDLFILGGDSVLDNSATSLQNLQSTEQRLKDVGSETIFVRGDQDKDLELLQTESYGNKVIGDINNIYLDTTVLLDGSESCGIDQVQLDFLRATLDSSISGHNILYMHHALWAHEGYIENVRPNSSTICAASFWKENVLPIVQGRVSAVISGDGLSFAEESKDGIRYILSGNSALETNKEDNSMGQHKITLTRITTNEGNLHIDHISLGDETFIDEAALENIETYDISIDNEELQDIYKNSPLYRPDSDWRSKVEPAALLDQLQDPIEAQLRGETVEINIRGNVGNHWDNFKKSWDINFPNSDSRQVKLIEPEDRRYINQLYVQRLSEWFNVPTPEIKVSRLILNDIDFGIYLEYEDFDKAFLELRGYNSNAIPSKNVFFDHFTTTAVDRDLSSSTGDKQDKSYQQNLSQVSFNGDNITDYFDRDNFARWLAIQIILGDKHQTTGDNFRYFTDKPTGRYIMVTWDAYLREIDESAPWYSTGPFNEAFMSNDENVQLVKDYVRSFLDNEAIFYNLILELEQEFKPVFTNDPNPLSSKASIALSIESLKHLHIENIPKLESWVSG